MSTIKADNIATLAGVSTSMANAVNGSAKAWVNFDGVGTVGIRAQYNVSSITDNGTGDYTANFTNAMVDANYALTTMGHTLSSGNSDQRVLGWDEGNTYSTTAVQITNRYYTGSNFDDTTNVSIAIFR